jgi:DnaJ-class molecular chaperone
VNGGLLLALAAVVGGVAWWVDLVVNPRARCDSCDGTGRHVLSRKNAWGNCRKCEGTGRRVRRGAKAAGRIVGRKL